MNILALVFRFLPLLISSAEKIFSTRPKSGAEKKEMVTTGAKAIVDVIEAVSTGGQKNTWDRIAPTVDNMIDDTAEILYGADKPSN